MAGQSAILEAIGTFINIRGYKRNERIGIGYYSYIQ